MSLLEIGKRKNLKQVALNLVNKHFETESTPFIITNKELPVIEESAYIIETLENAGYDVEPFTTKNGYGIKVTK